MYQLIRTFRFTIIIFFLLTLIFLFAKYLFLPILFFVLIMRFFNYFKFTKVKNKSSSNSKDRENSIIDAEYEDVE